MVGDTSFCGRISYPPVHDNITRVAWNKHTFFGKNINLNKMVKNKKKGAQTIYQIDVVIR